MELPQVWGGGGNFILNLFTLRELTINVAELPQFFFEKWEIKVQRDNQFC